MRIFMTGFMGAGKTTVGERLAALLALPFVDLDQEIERLAGSTVREIVERQGEPWFRRLELEALQSVVGRGDAVIATGGGTLTSELGARLIRDAGLSVWLNPSFATIVERIGALGKADRPLFREEAQVLALYRERLPAYRKADLTVDVAPDEAPEEVAARIGLLLRERRCAI
ncbi:MAG TPA: shikimate kinase [Thermoanaerobaculia bacterium]|jgi:shikimate kinase|nr:shikimate kinase [Thermoanaerobaculia bacterium]